MTTPLTDREQELLDWALRYREAGWSVFPIKRGEKDPVFPWARFQQTLPSRDEVAGWWSGQYKGCAIACATGSQTTGVNVVDLDAEDGRCVGADNLLALKAEHGEIPHTLRAVTGGGGVHLFFDANPFDEPIRNSASAIADKVDVRGQGGYVLLPPSDHPSGTKYQWFDGTPFGEFDAAEMPDWLADRARLAGSNGSGATAQRTPSPETDFSAFGQRVDGREEYMRDTVWAVAQDLARQGGKAPTEDEIFALAWPQYERAVKKRGASLESEGRGESECRKKARHASKKITKMLANGENLPPAPVKETSPNKYPNKIGGQDEAPQNDTFARWQPIEASDIPPRRWLYGRDYIRKFLTATVAPGGVGKSTLVLAEAISMASGSPILGHVPEGGRVKPSQLRVGYFNAEDPMDEVQRRVLATCEHHFVSQAALADRLWLASGRDHPLLLMEGDDGAVNEAALEFLRDFALAYDLDVLIFDPLANMTTSPETNDVFRQLTARLNRLAGDTETAVHIVHHTRKLQPGMAASDNDARGGRALVDGARSVRVLNHMSKEEAAKAGLDTGIDHFRSEDAKANLARRADRATWFERVSVKLDNGDHVATIAQWSWPDAFDGVTQDDLLNVQRAIAATDPPPRRSPQAKDWAGHIAARVLGIDAEKAAGKARVRVMLERWISTGAFRVDEIFDTRKKRDAPVLVVNEWADDN